MSKEKTGGPAFPFEYEDEIAQYVSHGMTLRDYFAAKAMQGLLAADKINDWTDCKCAEYAYEMADAMLKERGKL
jgi:hypothetical protein